MKQSLARRYLYMIFILFLGFALLQLWGSTSNSGSGNAEAKIMMGIKALDETDPGIRAAMALQEKHTPALMSLPDVVGTATGLTEEGIPAVLVFTKRTTAPGQIPDFLEGVPTVVKVTGEFHALAGKLNNKSAWPLPVPIGISTGNAGECSAGTISARVKDGFGNVYALSNNHVYALENKAPIGSTILQPGLYDTRCVLRGTNSIGTLYSFVTIYFDGRGNTVDAAIARSSTGLLGNATPAGGYGTPSSITVTAALGQAVQKYGRTTSLTRGTIAGINATVTVDYGTSGTATFVNQIIVGTSNPFIKPGDSGSLLVTDDADANPVGLLFAGNYSGAYSIANRIGDVLSGFGVTIDGK